MSARSYYEFVTEWTVEGTLAEVNSAFKDVEAFPRWWRPIYISARITYPGEPNGVARRVELATRGFLPYVLRWQIQVTESREPYGFTFCAWGDLIGVGDWELRPDGDTVKLRLNWKVRAHKTVVRTLSFLVRSLIFKNHAWAMNKGQRGLQTEIVRKRLMP
ncbi:MAG: polyketide cyclase [Bryobacterales bacterium]|nr:polyketide cyclase [Bryobacterales bacterium]